MTRSVPPFFFALLMGLSGIVAAIFPAISEVEQHVGLEWLFHWRGRIPPPADVVIIALDLESATRLRLPPKPSQWPRQIHAQLVQQLKQAGASVIVFDLLFDAPSLLPQQDALLATALQAANNVLLTESLEPDRLRLPGSTAHSDGEAFIEKTILPIALLAQSVIGTAPFPLPKNQRVDAAWFFKQGAGSIPTLPALALQIHAVTSYAALRRLLQQQDPTYFSSLPPDAITARRAGQSEKIGLQLRQYFALQPQRGQRLQQALSLDDTIDTMQKNRLRSLIDLYQGPDARYLNFYGPPRSITTIAFDKAIQMPAALAERVRGKVVFIGYSTSLPSAQDRIRDDYDTVFSQDDGLRLSGVEIGATAFANALDRSFVQPLDGLLRCVVFVAWGAVIALLSLRNPATRSIPALLLASGLYGAIALRLFSQYQLWMPLITPLLIQLPLALFCATLLRYLVAKKEKTQMQQTFSHFIPPEMVDNLSSGARPLGSIAPFSYGVCLATDAANYTRLAETMEPVVLTELMNRYYATLFAPVAAHGGTVSDIKGDAMLAIWSTESANSNHPINTADISLRRQACQAALQLHFALTDAPPGQQPSMLPTRIGLDCGPITVGNVGAGQHYEYRAVGDTVNTASRIEGLNKQLGTWVLASAAVVEGLDDFLLRPLGLFLLAGKSNPVAIVEIIDDACAAQRDLRKIDLCDAFSQALTLFQQQQYASAEAAFATILCTVPNDGPSAFYCQECVRKRTSNSVDNCNPVIRITKK